jgi:RNA polymerase sigma factor (sigma-70 family)
LAVAPITARAAVDVVPTLAPITIAAAELMPRTPPLAAVSVIAIAALDDWVIKVMKKQNKNLNLDENSHYQVDVVFPDEKRIIVSQEKLDKKNKLDNALKKLSSRQKEIIFMQYYEGLTIDEIQQITELKYQSIKNLTHRAMLVLRDSFEIKKK